MTEAEIVARIQRIFEDTLNVSAPAPETDIIESALLDSLALVTLLFGIEEEFATQIPLESLEIDDFRTVARIARLIGAAAQGPS
jgi:acyl carrier protein